MTVKRNRLLVTRKTLSVVLLKRIALNQCLASGFEGCSLIVKKEVDLKYGKYHCELYYWVGYSDVVGYVSPEGFNMLFDVEGIVGGSAVTEKVWSAACRNGSLHKEARRRLV